MLPGKRIMFVFGTRPEAIKMAPIIIEFKKYSDVFETVVVVTGQHREMLKQVLDIFDIKPDYDLRIMERGQTLSGIVVKTLQGLEELLLRERPDLMLVQGDTSTSFAASLSAFYHRIPLGHVEAGLRTRKKFDPFPEEMNRHLTTCIADLHFAPTAMAVQNLLGDGADKKAIYLTGNTVIDALQDIVRRPFNLKKHGLEFEGKKKSILITAHRRESFGLPLKNICRAVTQIEEKFGQKFTIILPVHKNPLVHDTVKEMLKDNPNIKLIDPLDYVPFVHLMKASYLILTDSGGIQEEAPSLGKPVLVLRETTERPEAVMAEAVKVVGTKVEDIVRETEKLLTDKKEYDKMAQAINPYGDGRAAERIVGAILHYFGVTDKRPPDFEVRESLKVKI